MGEPHVETQAVPRPTPCDAGRPITVEVTVRLMAVALPEADGGFSVAIPALRGCVTEGSTIEEVQANIVEAAEGWLATMHDHFKDEDIRVMRGEA
jgi:predicted RNase H-like HicB family nuclease